MKLPAFYLVNDRPVRLEETADGGLTVLVYNWSTGQLEMDMSYLSRCFNAGQDVDKLSEEEFTRHVEQLRAAARTS
jgi:hypothetical protein